MTDPVTPYVLLSDGRKMPAVGLGTFGSDKYGPDQIAEAVYELLKPTTNQFDNAYHNFEPEMTEDQFYCFMV